MMGLVLLPGISSDLLICFEPQNTIKWMLCHFQAMYAEALHASAYLLHLVSTTTSLELI